MPEDLIPRGGAGAPRPGPVAAAEPPWSGSCSTTATPRTSAPSSSPASPRRLRHAAELGRRTHPHRRGHDRTGPRHALAPRRGPTGNPETMNEPTRATPASTTTSWTTATTSSSAGSPSALRPDAAGFEALWAIHPDDYHVIQMHGRPVKTPRWQQAYGADYHYTGRTNAALPVPPVLEPFRSWAREAVDEPAQRPAPQLVRRRARPLHRAAPRQHQGHGPPAPPSSPSRSARGGSSASPIPAGSSRRDFPADRGTVFVMPYDTNLAWKHARGAACSMRPEGSLTFRAFQAKVEGRRGCRLEGRYRGRPAGSFSPCFQGLARFRGR